MCSRPRSATTTGTCGTGWRIGNVRYNARVTPEGDLATLLAAHRDRFRRVVPFDLTSGEVAVLDFTEGSDDLEGLRPGDTEAFTARVFERLAEAGVPVGVGRWGEDRVVYRHSALFDGEAERRSVHLGIDLFVVRGTEVMAPLHGIVHSVADNARVGDYGPTVILEHELDGAAFWSLYGHLGRDSVLHLEIGAEVAPGQPFAEVGGSHENGGWPPHLHFQLIADIGNRIGDFPGVATPSQRERWLRLCPDPNLVLGIPGL